MKTTTIFSLLIIFCLKIQAQTVIEGSVLDAQGKSGDAIVTVTSKGNSSVLAFAETDSKGDYRLEVNSQSDSLTITAAGMSIGCLLYTSPSPRDRSLSRMPSSA